MGVAELVTMLCVHAPPTRTRPRPSKTQGVPRDPLLAGGSGIRSKPLLPVGNPGVNGLKAHRHWQSQWHTIWSL
jgi:hypothetical protein